MEENKQKKAALERGERRPEKSGRGEDCPLCRVSEETLEKLKNNQPKKSFDEAQGKEKKKIKKPLWKLW